MAKMKNVNPPRRTTIRGQDHLLAYITPEEAEVLKARGGTGEAGPMGIPSFPEPGIGKADTGPSPDRDVEDFGDFRGSSEEEDAALQQDIAAAAARASGVEGLGDYQFERGDISRLFEPATYQGLLSGQGINLGGFSPLANRQAILEAQRAVMGMDPYQAAMSQIPARMKQAKAGYGMPGLLGMGLGKIGQFTLGQIQKGLEAGGRPVFDAQGNLAGVFTTGPFGLGEVYTGGPVKGMPETGWNAPDYGKEDVKPVDPVTGQCEEGYIFDEDLQACRLDTGASATAAPMSYEPGSYARMGLLDVAPAALPQFQQRYGVGFGSPMDFAAANTAFRQQAGTRPQYFNRPPQLDGYTLLS